MEIAYTHGPHTEQPWPDLAATQDYLASLPTNNYAPAPATQDFYPHPPTSGYVVEMGSTGLVNVSA